MDEREGGRGGEGIVTARWGEGPGEKGHESLEQYGEITGVSIETDDCGNGGRLRENRMVTKRGLSGPGMMKVSSYWNGGDVIHVDLLPDLDAGEWLLGERTSSSGVAGLLAQRLPQRFAQQWAAAHAVGPVRSLSDKRLGEIGAALNDWQVSPSGTLGYNKAEVTLGGVDTRQLSSKTMEAEHVPGLYFIGAVVDVTGHLGGHNFQWAWSSGYAAGQVA